MQASQGGWQADLNEKKDARTQKGIFTAITEVTDWHKQYLCMLFTKLLRYLCDYPSTAWHYRRTDSLTFKQLDALAVLATFNTLL